MDVSRFFITIPTLPLLLCLDTGYEFYHPDKVVGDPDFYSALCAQDSNRDWAYKDTKWGFEEVLDLVTPDFASALDVGAGRGAFLELLKGRVKDAAGLETSPFALQEAADRGLLIHDETVASHASQDREAYDLVTAFQVLEHVYDVSGFMRACVKMTAVCGSIVISVPDNDGFVGMQRDLPLNLPPHHVGRWRRASLEAIAEIFGLRVLRIEHKPLQLENVAWYCAAMERPIFARFSACTRGLLPLWRR